MHVQPTEVGVSGVVTPVDEPGPARVLRAAAEVIDRNGWAQGAYFDVDVAGLVGAGAAPVCAAGAIRVAATGLPDQVSVSADRAESAFAEFLRGAFGLEWSAGDEPVEVIASWNDDEDRRADQVVAALREAAGEVA